MTTGVSHQFVVDLVCCHLPYKIWFVHHLLSPYLAVLSLAEFGYNLHNKNTCSKLKLSLAKYSYDSIWLIAKNCITSCHENMPGNVYCPLWPLFSLIINCKYFCKGCVPWKNATKAICWRGNSLTWSCPCHLSICLIDPSTPWSPWRQTLDNFELPGSLGPHLVKQQTFHT